VWVWSNAVAARGEGVLILVDPGIDRSDLTQLADDLDRLGLSVVSGFSTRSTLGPTLHPRLGSVPRQTTAASAHTASQARGVGAEMAADSTLGIPLELFGVLTSLPAGGEPVPGELVEHQAHAIVTRGGAVRPGRHGHRGWPVGWA